MPRPPSSPFADSFATPRASRRGSLLLHAGGGGPGRWLTFRRPGAPMLRAAGALVSALQRPGGGVDPRARAGVASLPERFADRQGQIVGAGDPIGPRRRPSPEREGEPVGRLLAIRTGLPVMQACRPDLPS